jgi:hypothetical protein
MAEKTGKPALKKDSLTDVLKKIENLSRKYINQGSDSAAKKTRKNGVLSSMEKLASEIENYGNCGRGTHWDPISMTCKPD